jgi:hypothetical protein
LYFVYRQKASLMKILNTKWFKIESFFLSY